MRNQASTCAEPPRQWPLEASPRSSLVVLKGAGEPSEFTHKLKGDARPLPIRDGWSTTCTIKGHVVACTVLAAEGQTCALYIMQVISGTQPARTCRTCGQRVAAGILHCCSASPIATAKLLMPLLMASTHTQKQVESAVNRVKLWATAAYGYNQAGVVGWMHQATQWSPAPVKAAKDERRAAVQLKTQTRIAEDAVIVAAQLRGKLQASSSKHEALVKEKKAVDVQLNVAHDAAKDQENEITAHKVWCGGGVRVVHCCHMGG